MVDRSRVTGLWSVWLMPRLKTRWSFSRFITTPSWVHSWNRPMMGLALHSSPGGKVPVAESPCGCIGV